MGILSREKKSIVISSSQESLDGLLREGNLEGALRGFLQEDYTPQRFGEAYYSTLNGLVKKLKDMKDKKRDKLFYEINKELYGEFFGKKLGLKSRVEPLDGKNFEKELEKALKANRDIVYRAVGDLRKKSKTKYAGEIKKLAEYFSRIWEMQETIIRGIKERPGIAMSNLEAAIWQDVGAYYLRELSMYNTETGKIEEKDRKKAVKLINEISHHMGKYGMERAILFHYFIEETKEVPGGEESVVMAFPIGEYIDSLTERKTSPEDLKRFLESSPLGKMMVLKAAIGDIDEKIVEFAVLGGKRGEMCEPSSSGWEMTEEEIREFRKKEKIRDMLRPKKDELEKKILAGTATDEEIREYGRLIEMTPRY